MSLNSIQDRDVVLAAGWEGLWFGGWFLLGFRLFAA